MIKEPEDCVKAAAVWTLGQLGSHSSNHAKAMAEAAGLLRAAAPLYEELGEAMQKVGTAVYQQAGADEGQPGGQKPDDTVEGEYREV